MVLEIVSTSFQDFFESLGSYCEQHPIISKELLQAKDKFFLLTGKLKDNDQEFGNRVNAFLLWFLFDRRFRKNARSPLQYYKEHLENEKNSSEIALLDEQIDHVHSLFKFIRIKNGYSLIKDIVNRKKYLISDGNSLLGFEKGVYFETRLFSFRGEWCLANYTIRHPMAVKKEIRKKLKSIRNDRREQKQFFLELHSYFTKWHSYRSIDIKNIYRFDRSFPGSQ